MWKFNTVSTHIFPYFVFRPKIFKFDIYENSPPWYPLLY